MEELVVAFRERRLNTKKKTSRKQLWVEMAIKINDEKWFPRHHVTPASLSNKHDTEKNRYDLWASIAFKSGNRPDDEGKVTCSIESRNAFLLHNPKGDWIFERGLPRYEIYREIWDEGMGNGDEIRTAEELGLTQEVDADVEDEEDDVRCIGGAP
ncbi:hypothetical protein CMUS01_04077 [Colletotrichum musicola]|uniref:Uncharacterized protein n=1 Tax=Colletotrichum musicola TaxID=2175873 RepID=A0A8H6U1M5_9PEZI|nr:hypothetical protein CMUS01_04077 [Colletotrichum musicola]